MIRTICLVLALCVSACTTTNSRTTKATIERPPAGATLVVVKPDVTLAALTASGIGEPRADWIASATENLSRQTEYFARQRGFKVTSVDPATVPTGRGSQIVKLHNVVARSIVAYSYAVALPSKKEFDWTLGDGVSAMTADGEGSYALFMRAEGTYSTAGRAAMTVAMAMAGVALPTGGQQVFVSLVDLKTGRVVWSNVAIAGPNDMRTPEGAAILAEALFKDAPL